jgi:hypothetical protein
MHRHSLERLEIGDGGQRERDRGRSHCVPVGDDGHRGHVGDLGETAELVHRAGHLDQVTLGDIDPEAPVEDEDAL